MEDRYKISQNSTGQFVIVDDNNNLILSYSAMIVGRFTVNEICRELNKAYFEGCYRGFENAKNLYGID